MCGCDDIVIDQLYFADPYQGTDAIEEEAKQTEKFFTEGSQALHFARRQVQSLYDAW